MGKLNKYPLQKIIFYLTGVMLLAFQISGCSDRTVQFLETEMESEEIVHLTPAEIQEAQLQETGEQEDAVKESVLQQEVEQYSQERIFVYVCGAVVSPGVYELEADSRVFQAVELAGGFLDTAALEYINQAMTLTDGQRIYIPTQDEIENEAVFSTESEFSDSLDEEIKNETASGKVNINTADQKELMTINGIGESRAQDIIDYRQQHGDFSKIEEIMNVPGIKEATFEKIKDSIEVK